MSKKINNKISLIAYLIANRTAIPPYCYHNYLSISGNCRVCLVELKNSIKPVVSCATNAKAALHNNSVYHESALVKKARENKLINFKNYFLKIDFKAYYNSIKDMVIKLKLSLIGCGQSLSTFLKDLTFPMALKYLGFIFLISKIMSLPEMDTIIGFKLWAIFSGVASLFSDFYGEVRNIVSSIKNFIIELVDLHRENERLKTILELKNQEISNLKNKFEEVKLLSRNRWYMQYAEPVALVLKYAYEFLRISNSGFSSSDITMLINTIEKAVRAKANHTKNVFAPVNVYQRDDIEKTDRPPYEIDIETE